MTMQQERIAVRHSEARAAMHGGFAVDYIRQALAGDVRARRHAVSSARLAFRFALQAEAAHAAEERRQQARAGAAAHSAGAFDSTSTGHLTPGKWEGD